MNGGTTEMSFVQLMHGSSRVTIALYDIFLIHLIHKCSISHIFHFTFQHKNCSKLQSTATTSHGVLIIVRTTRTASATMKPEVSCPRKPQLPICLIKTILKYVNLFLHENVADYLYNSSPHAWSFNSMSTSLSDREPKEFWAQSWLCGPHNPAHRIFYFVLKLRSAQNYGTVLVKLCMWLFS